MFLALDWPKLAHTCYSFAEEQFVLADNISPLAQRLADAYDVDLSKLEAKHLEGKITARSVLDYLNASETSTSPERKILASPDAVETTTVAERQPQPTLSPEFTPTGEAAAPKQEPKREAAQPAPPVPKQGSSAEAVADTIALAKTRAQLQVTAKVHQQALMQVGALREQNSFLEAELTLLKEAEAQTRSQLEALQKHDEPLEVEVEAAGNRGIFGWLRKLFS